MGALTYEWTLAGISWQTSQGRRRCKVDQHKERMCFFLSYVDVYLRDKL